MEIWVLIGHKMKCEVGGKPLIIHQKTIAWTSYARGNIHAYAEKVSHNIYSV